MASSSDNSFLQRLKERKLVQWALAYLAGAWLAVQVLAAIAEPWGLSVGLVRTLQAALIVGFLVTLVLAWYHGERGRQRVSGPELLIIAGLLVVSTLGFRFFALGDPGAPTVTAFEEAPADAASIRALAVLPFENLSGDPSRDYVAAGMTDVLTTTLGTLGSLRVISRQSTMEFRGSTNAPGDIAAQLGVDALISGSVLQVSDDVRIVAQLADARSGDQVWTASYEGSAGEIFALQSETARTIAEQIQLVLSPEEERRLSRTQSISPEAWDAYFRGRYHREDYTENGLSLAIEAFNEALEIEPDFASAHADLAQAYMLAIQFGHLPNSEYAPRARAEAEEAIRLDPGLAEALISVANMDYRGGRDWDGLEDQFLLAIEVNPNLADAWHYYSHFLMSNLRVEEAVEAALRGVEVDPMARSMRLHLSVTYYMARRYDDAIAVALETLDRFPDYSRIRGVLGNAYARTGQYEQALEQYGALVALSREWDNLLGLATAHALAGNDGEARQILSELTGGGGPPYHIGLIFGTLGEMDSAFEWMESAVDANQGTLADLLISPSFGPFRADTTRWRALLERAGFSEELIDQAMTMDEISS